MKKGDTRQARLFSLVGLLNVVVVVAGAIITFSVLRLWFVLVPVAVTAIVAAVVIAGVDVGVGSLLFIVRWSSSP